MVEALKKNDFKPTALKSSSTKKSSVSNFKKSAPSSSNPPPKVIDNIDNRDPFLEPPLPSLDTFASKYDLHDHCIVACYHIYRDLHIKRELNNLDLINAKKYGKNEYFIQGTLREPPNKTRIMIPCHLDADVDLHWLQEVASKLTNTKTEVQLVIHTAETVIYQNVHIDLPVEKTITIKP